MTIDFASGNFVHLGLGATTVPLPKHTGDMEWYQQYGQTHGADGNEGRLVSWHTFTAAWEMHPEETELVLCQRHPRAAPGASRRFDRHGHAEPR